MTTVTEITYHSKSRNLEIGFASGQSFTLSAEYLRVYSPSAEVQGHSPDQAVLQHGKQHVSIRQIEPQGNYAIKLTFSDGHDSGIYSWDYLFALGDEYEQRWSAYLADLEQAGKTRDPGYIALSSD